MMIVLCFAAFVGGYTAWQALQRDQFALAFNLGQWRAYLSTQTGDVPPYEKARLALYTQAQLGYGEGLRFVALNDDEGRALSRKCRYSLVGPAPKSRIFSLFAADLDGLPLKASNSLPNALHTWSIGYNAQNELRISVGSSISSGDWLYVPKPEAGESANYQLVFSLYNTSIGAVSDATKAELPVLKRLDCEGEISS